MGGGKQYRYGLINHMTQKDVIKDGKQISILTSNYEKFIDDILECEIIISSSLHGIILAEIYGVPAILYFPETYDAPMLKYRDYYYSTGRYDFPLATTLEEAIKLEPLNLPDFSDMKQNIERVFPYDLWRGGE